MASRKFKAAWTPTPLPTLEERTSAAPRNAKLPIPIFDRTYTTLKFFLVLFVREFLYWLTTLLPGKRARSASLARHSRDFAESVGGMWVILNRLAALRSDLLGEEFCRELALTRDRSEPRPFAIIRQVIDEELRSVGKVTEEIFASIDETALSATWVAQYHRARLKGSKQEVVVRVRMPDAQQRSKMDWFYMRALLFIAERLDFEPHLRWADLLFEVKKFTEDQLDFRTEVSELRHIRKVLRPRQVYVPIVYRSLCTERMLTTEHIEGISVAKIQALAASHPERCDAWMRENKIDMRRVWRRLFNAHQELLFEHNLFFSELAAANVVLLEGNRLALVSFSVITTMETELIRKYRQLCRALLDSDFTKVSDIYLTLGPPIPYKDISDMRISVQRALRKWETRTHVKKCSYEEKSIGAALGHMAVCASGNGLPSLWIMARLQLAEIILNDSLAFLDCSQNSVKALRRYEEKAQFRVIKNVATKGVGKRFNSAVDVVQLNMQLAENLEHDAEYLRRRLMGFQGKVGALSQIMGRMLMLSAKVVLVVLVVQAYTFVKQTFQVGVPLAERGALGHFLAMLGAHNHTTLIILLLTLFYFRRFLRNLANQLFSAEVKPSDVN